MEFVDSFLAIIDMHTQTYKIHTEFKKERKSSKITLAENLCIALIVYSIKLCQLHCMAFGEIPRNTLIAMSVYIIPFLLFSPRKY